MPFSVVLSTKPTLEEKRFYTPPVFKVHLKSMKAIGSPTADYTAVLATGVRYAQLAQLSVIDFGGHCAHCLKHRGNSRVFYTFNFDHSRLITWKEATL